MLSFSFASPYYLDTTLDPARDPVEVVARVQQARKSNHARNRSTAGTNEPSLTPHSSDSITPLSLDKPVHPSMLQRRASLESALSGLPPQSQSNLLGSEIPSGATNTNTTTAPTDTKHAKKLSNSALSRLSVLGEVDMPYQIQSTQEHAVTMSGLEDHPEVPRDLSSVDESGSHSNGLPHIDLSTAPFSLTNMKSLMKMCRAGFASDQRAAVWPKLLVLPSTVVHVDVSAYYRTIETVWHLPTGSLTSLLQEDEDSNTYLVLTQANALKQQLPSVSLAPPLLGRSLAFDWSVAMHRAPSDRLAQQRVLAAVCATHELTYAPQLPPLIAIVYHALSGDEARTYAFVCAMVDRSKRDEQFLLLSPVSMELAIIAFRRALSKHMPDLDKHFVKTGFDASAWFRTLFLDSFLGSVPDEAVLRVWDLAITSGFASTAIKFGLTSLAKFEQYLLSSSTSEDLQEKLMKLLRIMNVTSLFGGTQNHSGGWSSESGLYNKTDLAKLTTPSKDMSIMLIDELNLEPRLYHVPILPHETKDDIIDSGVWHQLYSTILPSQSSRLDPHRIYSTSYDGHSLRTLLREIAEEQTTASGVLLLVQTTTRQKFGVYFDQFPSLASSEAQEEKEKIDAESSSTAEQPAASTRALRSAHLRSGFIIDFNTATIMTRRFVGAPLSAAPTTMLQLDESSGESSSGSSLPVLPVEGGPNSSRNSSDATAIGATKRRGSLALLLDALHLKKSDDGTAAASLNSEAANKMLANCPPLSPFKHANIRIVDHHATQPDFSRASTTAASSKVNTPTSSAPVSPRRAFSVPVSTGAIPLVTRRQSIVDGLQRVWSFIDSVPTPQSNPNSAHASLNASPALTRKQSIAGVGGAPPSLPTSATNSPREASTANSAPRSQKFFPSISANSAPTSVASSPARSSRTLGSTKSLIRTTTSLPPRSSTSADVQPSPVQTSLLGLRPRSMTTVEKSSSHPSDLERHLSLMKEREAGWDAAANLSVTLESATPLTPGSAANLYRRAISSPAQSSEFDQLIQLDSHAPNRRSSLATSSVASSLLSDGDADAESETGSEPAIPSRNASPSLEDSMHHDEMLSVRVTPDKSSNGPSPASTPTADAAPSFLETSKAFRAQHSFHLSIDDDADMQGQSHVQTVRTALNRNKSKQTIDSIDMLSTTNGQIPASNVGTATVLMSQHAFVLSDPTNHLLFSLNDTLEEGCIQCDGIDCAEEVEFSAIEAWSFQ